MEAMRAYMSALVEGWEVDRVPQIVAETLDDIVDPLVYEEAVELIESHRLAGLDIIIISSSGTDVVEPIGARLGAHLTIGTQVAIEEGRYTGEILFYAYGEGKAEAMRSLAVERGYHLQQCYAYSDSQTDLPMLEAVGHPFAVNPDAALRQAALDRDWPILDFAKPVAMRCTIETKQAVAARASVELGAVAAGLTWYARRSMTSVKRAPRTRTSTHPPHRLIAGFRLLSMTYSEYG
jgi:HAD-superfamily subfamily IB hydrolase, TIGR01490